MGATCSKVQRLPRRILLIGQSGAGKTQILYTWILKYTDFDPTATTSFNVEEVKSTSGQHYIVWDLGGAENFKLRHRQFFHGTEGIIYVLDASKMTEKEEIKADFTNLLRERDLCHVPFLVLVNKTDLSGSSSVEEWQSALGLNSVTDRPWKILSVSATDKSSYLSALDALDDLYVN